MMTPLEQKLLEQLEAKVSPSKVNPLYQYENHTESVAEAYHNLMEGVRSRVDAEMMAYSFEQSKLHFQQAEQVARAAAQGLQGKPMGYSE